SILRSAREGWIGTLHRVKFHIRPRPRELQLDAFARGPRRVGGLVQAAGDSMSSETMSRFIWASDRETDHSETRRRRGMGNPPHNVLVKSREFNPEGTSPIEGLGVKTPSIIVHEETADFIDRKDVT